jgi:hypothetical protein
MVLLQGVGRAPGQVALERVLGSSLVRQFLLQNVVTVRTRLPGVNISDHAMRVCAPSFFRRVLLTSRCCTAQLTAHAGIR